MPLQWMTPTSNVPLPTGYRSITKRLCNAWFRFVDASVASIGSPICTVVRRYDPAQRRSRPNPPCRHQGLTGHQSDAFAVGFRIPRLLFRATDATLLSRSDAARLPPSQGMDPLA